MQFNLLPDSVDWVLWALLAVGVGAVVLAAFIAWAVIRYASGSGKGEFEVPSTGVVIVEGLPGSGKSFFAVGEVLKFIIHNRRPVYTNLPLRWRVFRQYLRLQGGDELAGLLYRLSEAHWRRFLERAALHSELGEWWKIRKAEWTLLAAEVDANGDRGRAAAMRRRAMRKFSEARMERLMERRHGPSIFEGAKANWIHPTAVIVIDEIHKWHRQEDQRTESKTLLGYLSMHRHHMHMIMCISQDRMQVAIQFRRLCQNFWQVWNRGEDTIAWGIRWKHFGIRAFGYARYTPEAEEAKSKEESAPLEQMTVFPSMPRHRWKFRIYDSFTHAGSRRAQMRARAEARRRAGMNDDGRLEWEEEMFQRKQAEKREAKLPHRRMRWAARQLRRAAVVGLVAGVAYSWGRVRTPSVGAEAAAVIADPTKLEAAAAPGDGVHVVDGKLVWGKWSGMGPDFVRMEGKRVKVGERYGLAKLEALYPGDRLALWAVGDAVWVWKYRDPGPERMGEAAAIRNAIFTQLAAAGRAFGGSVPTAPGDGGEALGSEAGHAMDRGAAVR